jgi:iron(III) transport system permease protein
MKHGFDFTKLVLYGFALVLCLLIVLPMSWLVYYGFTDKNGAFSLQNFVTLVNDPTLRDPLITTFILATSTSLICCVVAAPMGWLVARTDMPLRRTVRLLVTASFVTPPFLGAIAWELLAAPNSGLLNKLYRTVSGAEMDEHIFNIYSFPGLIFVIACYTFPYVFVLVANALDRTPSELEDASSILGGSTWVTARRVTIPLVLPALLAGALVAFLQAMTLFGSPAILALPAGFHTMTTKIWSLFQYPPKPELAAAASLPLLILTVMLLRAEHMILGRRSYAVLGGKNSAPRLIQLGGLRWVALAFCFIVLLNPVFLPYGALLNATFSKVASQFVSFSNFTFHNIYFVFFELSATKLALYNTFVLGIATATIGTVIAVVIAYLTTREAVTGHKALGFLATAPVRHPGHRARRRPVPELHPAAVRSLRHAVDPAARFPDPCHAGRLSADAVGVQGYPSRAGGRQPHPRRHAAPRVAGDYGAAAAHLGDRDLVLRLRRHHPRVVGRGHAVHLGDQGHLGADLRPQRERRPRGNLGPWPDHAGGHLGHRRPGQPAAAGRRQRAAAGQLM